MTHRRAKGEHSRTAFKFSLWQRHWKESRVYLKFIRHIQPRVHNQTNISICFLSPSGSKTSLGDDNGLSRSDPRPAAFSEKTEKPFRPLPRQLQVRSSRTFQTPTCVLTVAQATSTTTQCSQLSEHRVNNSYALWFNSYIIASLYKRVCSLVWRKHYGFVTNLTDGG